MKAASRMEYLNFTEFYKGGKINFMKEEIEPQLLIYQPISIFKVCNGIHHLLVWYC